MDKFLRQLAKRKCSRMNMFTTVLKKEDDDDYDEPDGDWAQFFKR